MSTMNQDILSTKNSQGIPLRFDERDPKDSFVFPSKTAQQITVHSSLTPDSNFSHFLI